MLIAAPEANPHQFVQRVLLARDRSGNKGGKLSAPKPDQRDIKSRTLGRVRVPATQF